MNLSVKEKLHEYIETAEEAKLQAIYTLVENEIKNRDELYDGAEIAKFKAVSDNYFAGKIKGYSMEESLQRMKKSLAASDI